MLKTYALKLALKTYACLQLAVETAVNCIGGDNIPADVAVVMDGDMGVPCRAGSATGAGLCCGQMAGVG